MKKLAMFAAVAVLAVSGAASAADVQSTTIVNDRGETVTITNRSVGYNDYHPVNPSALIPGAFEKQLPPGAAETITYNLLYTAT